MDTAEHSLDEPRQRAGCLRGFFIAIGVVVGLAVLAVVLILFLTLPGRAQMDRLESSPGAGTEIVPEITNGGTVIEISQSAVTAMLRPSIGAALADVPEVRFIGIDVRFEDNEVDILAGVEGRIPKTGIRRNAVLENRVRVELDPEGWIALTPVRVMFGRLPLPTGRLVRAIWRNTGGGWSDAGTGDSGIRFDPAGGRLLVDLQPYLDQFIPGMEVRSIRAVRGTLRIALRVPDAVSRSLENIILTAAAGKGTLLAGLESVLPPDKQELAGSIRGLFDSIAGTAADKPPFEGATVSYVEGDVEAKTPGTGNTLPVDIGDRLPAGTRIFSGSNSWAELVFPPSHIVKVAADSEFVVNIAQGNGKKTALSVDAGRMRLLVSRLTDKDEFTVSTSNAVMAVRGTDFVVDVSGSATTQLVVLDGRVGVAKPDGSGEIPVDPDQTLTIKDGRIGNPAALDVSLRSEIAEELEIRTNPADLKDLMYGSIVNITLSHVMTAAKAWADLDEETQSSVQDVIDEHMAGHPEIGRAVDEFFLASGLEDRRGEFERMFE
jgi:hypothetical protein